MMQILAVNHIALWVTNLREAKFFYRQLFSMQTLLRVTKTEQGREIKIWDIVRNSVEQRGK